MVVRVYDTLLVPVMDDSNSVVLKFLRNEESRGARR